MTDPRDDPLLTPQDPFSDVRQTERAELQDLEADIAAHEKAIRMAEGCLRLRSQPGWEEFSEALADIAEFELERLPDAKPEAVAGQQGVVRGVRMVLSVMRNTERRLAEFRSARDSLVERKGRLFPNGRLAPSRDLWRQ